ncbi:Golgi SNAP receptor complex member 1-like [Ctenocephalides felis]|uniref:Golgi SNAP receptor complex member 1-like n=1 Tax=Ctenocephalides felis TaxID=7515 RepID=UPI000E6E1315|nr:Golgi SNAP receptor complex member 1-like [Ctenocephalides felis]
MAVKAQTMSWEDLRKQARHLENDVDLKLVAFSKMGISSPGGLSSGGSDKSPLLGEHICDNMAMEIDGMLEKLSTLNEKMSELPASGAAMLHTIQRHREILQGYKQEFRKIQSNHNSRREREELLRDNDSSMDKMNSVNAGLNRRDLFLKESSHINSSHNLVNDQISIAVETRDNLLSQRQTFKRMKTRFNDINNKFPVINNLMQRIRIRKRSDSLILGFVIAVCTILLFLYAFH